MHTNKKLILLSALCLFFITCTKSTLINTINQKEATTPFEISEKAQQYYEVREYKRAIREYSKILEIFSSKKAKYEKELAWATYEIGFCYLVMKKYKRAFEYFDKVVKFYSAPAPKKLASDRIKEINTKYVQ
ncbi:hypothetical protein ACFL6D_02180 [Spirochaetota bacterium]